MIVLMLSKLIIRASRMHGRCCSLHTHLAVAGPTMPLVAASDAPVYVAFASAKPVHETTPESLQNVPPKLVMHMDQVQVGMRPVPPALHTLAGSRTDALECTGQLWLTEKNLTFLTQDKLGFQIDYPSIALHAISRFVPDDVFTNTAGYATNACLYCQLDDHPERDENDDEDDDVKELWFLVGDDNHRTSHASLTTVDTLYESLSHCAALHPSMGGSDEFAHPLAGIAGMSRDEDDEDEGDDVEDVKDVEKEENSTRRVRSELQSRDARYRPY